MNTNVDLWLYLVRTYVANGFDPCTLEGITLVSVWCETVSGGGGAVVGLSLNGRT